MAQPAPARRRPTLAVGEIRRRPKGTADIALLAVAGGHLANVTVAQTDLAVPEPAAWWPDGKGLLVWSDTGGSASLAADGLPLQSLDLQTGRQHTLATALQQQTITFTGPREVAFGAGDNRSIWDGAKHVDVCNLVSGAGAHSPTSIPTGTVYIRGDRLWVLDRRTGQAHDVAGPLGTGDVYADSYYGQIDWPATYAWHP